MIFTEEILTNSVTYYIYRGYSKSIIPSDKIFLIIPFPKEVSIENIPDYSLL